MRIKQELNRQNIFKHFREKQQGTQRAGPQMVFETILLC